MSHFDLKYSQYNERSILIEWPSIIDQNIVNDIRDFKKKIKNNTIESLLYIINTYNSILVIYDLTIDKINDEVLALQALYATESTTELTDRKLWHIPVCYDDYFATDLQYISEQNGLSTDAIIEAHCSTKYSVSFIGFLPGFLYLSGLPKPLHTDRKSTPDFKVKKGAVAIGGQQTGIYPMESPGGWHVIGNSPISFFDPKNEIPCFAVTGDKIKFVPMDLKAHHHISELVNSRLYKLNYDLIDG